MKSFDIEAKNAKSLIFPHKKIALDELRQIDGPIFELNGVDITFDHRVIDRLNAEIGTSRSQLQTVRNASGDTGEVNFRNYLSMARSLAERKEVVIMADPSSRKVVNVIIPKNDFIPIDQFFDFAGLFMEDAGYDFEQMRTSVAGEMEIIVYMQSLNPTVVEFAPGEETVTDGAFLRWTGDAIELGNLYTRQVCVNGMTETVERKRGTLTKFNPGEVKRIIMLAKSRELPTIGFEKYKQKALEAITTPCSLGELRLLHGRLQRIGANLHPEVIDGIIPYIEYDNHFKSRGVDTKHQGPIIKTDITAWQLFNRLTDFASHTELLEQYDSTRHVIQNMATTFLKADRDIKQYIEYV